MANAIQQTLDLLKTRRAVLAKELDQVDSTIAFIERQQTPTGRPAKVRKSNVAQRQRLKKGSKKQPRNVGAFTIVGNHIPELLRNNQPLTRDQIAEALVARGDLKNELGAVPRRTVGLTLSMLERMHLVTPTADNCWIAGPVVSTPAAPAQGTDISIDAPEGTR